ncbi:MAG TPA: SRPBCC family protein [Rhizomicrobium sp.]|nr:SRPBCC family protein [Rhizomicrobium sp.]
MSDFVYVTYIKSTPQKVWDAITTPEFTRQYWGKAMVSDWKPGSKWEMVNLDSAAGVNMTGEVMECDPPSRLVISWVKPENRGNTSETSRVTFEIALDGGMVRLNVIHDQLQPGSAMEQGISSGWPRVLSGLKTLLETGNVLVDLVAYKGGCSAAA